MPEQALEQRPIDWAGIRANAGHVGIREAARQAAADLPEDEKARFVSRVLKRADREGWTQALQASIKSAKVPGKPMSSKVFTGAESVAEAQAEWKGRGNFAVTKAAALGAEDIAAKDVDEIHQLSPVLVQYATALAKANPVQQSNGPLVSLTFAAQLPDYLKPCGTPSQGQLPTAPVEEE